MRIVTWNCNGAFRDKYEQVAALKDHYKDDILVIQEAENPDQLPAAVRERYPNVVYVEGTRNKGLLVLASERHKIEIAPEYDENYRFVVPIRVSGDVDCTLIAVWGQKTADLWYTDYDLEALKLYESLIDERTMVAGDFNSTPTVKKPRKSDTDHGDLVTWLQDHGLESAYHRTTGEAHGHESRPTFALYRDLTKRLPHRLRVRPARGTSPECNLEHRQRGAHGVQRPRSAVRQSRRSL